ncbi:hypothetical protein L1887_35701 [Cichorium endivia]|nr:hypothetical protein L1887_35701 [Cichorium endivia]
MSTSLFDVRSRIAEHSSSNVPSSHSLQIISASQRHTISLPFSLSVPFNFRPFFLRHRLLLSPSLSPSSPTAEPPRTPLIMDIA